MRGIKSWFIFLAVIAIVFACSSQLFAQASRTWVSGVGDDANPCSRTAPCKTFAGAISKTAAGGIISVLDPGGYGAVTISKSITIDGAGIGSILAAGTNGVNVNAAATDKVFLKGLQIHGVGTGLNGVRFIQGDSLYVENCTISDFTQKGVSFEPAGSSTTAKLFVKDTTVCNVIANPATSPYAISLVPGASANARATIEKSRLEGNTRGLLASSRAKATIHDSVIAGNSGIGVYAIGSQSEVNIESSILSNNGGTAVQVNSASAVIRLSNSAVMDNNTGLAVGAAGGGIISYGNNRIAGNTAGDGAPTAVATMQ